MKPAVCLAWFLVVCGAQGHEKITDANNQLGFRLLQKIPTSIEKNLFFSPYSVSAAMAMAYVGARNETQTDLRVTLGYTSAGLTNEEVPSAYDQITHLLRTASNSTVRVANAAVVQNTYAVLREYLDALSQYFEAEVSRVNLNDEQSLDIINEWVKNKTEGKIEKLLSEPLPPNAKLVLLNAIYFKGLWNTPFQATATSKAPFFNAGVQSVDVDTMHARLRFTLATTRPTQMSLTSLMPGTITA